MSITCWLGKHIRSSGLCVFKFLWLKRSMCGAEADRTNELQQTDSEHTDLPMGSHIHTASTHHCGKCCETTWRGLRRQRTWPCSRDKVVVLSPGMRNLTHKQRRSNAASCCLRLQKYTIKINKYKLLRFHR